MLLNNYLKFSFCRRNWFKLDHCEVVVYCEKDAGFKLLLK